MRERLDLLTGHLHPEAQGRYLISNIADLAFIQALAEKVAHIALYHPDCAVLRQFHQTFAAQPGISIHEDIFPSGQRFDAALLALPISPGMGKGLLATALECLAPGGRLVAVGHSSLGGQAALRNAQQLAPTRLLAQDDSHLAFECQRPAQLAIPAAWRAFWQPQPMTYHLQGRDYSVYSQPGIFSWDRLEAGAAFLIDNLQQLKLPQQGTILDAGCGYGLLGMVLRDHTRARKTVWVDKNLLAVRATRLSLPGEAVECADLTLDSLPQHAPFDLIFCNPPFYDPYKDNTDFMRLFTPRVPAMLSEGGQFLVVTRAVFQFHEFMEQHFPAMEILMQKDGFCIMLGRKTPRTTAQSA